MFPEKPLGGLGGWWQEEVRLLKPRSLEGDPTELSSPTAHSLEETLKLGKTESRRRKGRRDEMVGWHHRFTGRELGRTPGDGERQGGLASCSQYLGSQSNMIGQLNNNNGITLLHFSDDI